MKTKELLLINGELILEAKNLLKEDKITINNATSLELLPIDEQVNYLEKAQNLSDEEFLQLVKEKLK
jgi:hypothetical protein